MDDHHRLNIVFVIWQSGVVVQVLLQQAQGMLGEAVQSEAAAIFNMIDLPSPFIYTTRCSQNSEFRSQVLFCCSAAISH
jgi:hypothetical protein